MKEKKNIIIIIAVLLFLIIIVLAIMKIVNKKNEELKYIEEENPELTVDIDLKELNDENEFVIVQNCINDYFISLANKNYDKALDLLNGEYVSKNNITKQNVLNNNYEITNDFEYFIADQVYYREISVGTEFQYFVYGRIISRDNGIKNAYIIANLDYNNSSYNITPSSEIEVSENEYLRIIEQLKSSNTNEFKYAKDLEQTEIKLNEYNKINANVQVEDILYYYLKNYAILAVYDTNNAYNLLDDEYKEKRFENLNQYRDYIDKNKNTLLNCTIASYNINDNDEYKEYIIKDTNNNYYIFRITGFMEYKVILDFYTVDLEQIINKYDEGSEKDKVTLNVQKIAAAINSGDYKYIYNKLADSFKENKFSSYEKFESYMSRIFVGKLDYSINSFSNEGKTFICSLVFSGTTASNNRTINMQIIMQLKEDRDFVMSFSIQ